MIYFSQVKNETQTADTLPPHIPKKSPQMWLKDTQTSAAQRWGPMILWATNAQTVITKKWLP